MTKKTIKEYEQKRNFTKTPEPAAKKKIATKSTAPIFVMQEHHASHVHWDLRLEIDGVMPSWALPKGPSTDPKIKRLAVRTEDHPISYANFEGIIPEGEYGAGTVMVWDIGTYENIHTKDGILIPMEQSLKEGRIEVVLHGQKLRGAYIMIRLKDGDNWLFFKKTDEYASVQNILAENKSALTQRTIEQITRGKK